jgi:predicted phage terminase large subunit-like protein
MIFSVALPAYLLGKDPTRRIICASYSDTIAAKLANDFRSLLRAPWYARAFGVPHLTKDTETETATSAGGFRLTTTVGGSLTGRGGDLIIIDDPLNASEAASKASRDRVNDWFRTSVLSRLDDPRLGAIIVVMQRLHVEDLSGVLLAHGGWTHLCLPAIAPEDMQVTSSKTATYHWRRGESLHPARLPLSELNRIKAQLGSYAFNAQYLQAPAPPEGGMLKRSWLRFVDTIPPYQSGDQIVQSWDTALKAKDSNDYSAGLCFLVRGANEIYLTNIVRERMEFPELVNRVIQEARASSASAVLIEDHASGTSLIQFIRETLSAVVGTSPQADKATRMYVRTPMLEGGVLRLPKNAPWLDDFLDEYLAFPNGKTDDQIDALSQFLNWQHERQREIFSVDWGWDDAWITYG